MPNTLNNISKSKQENFNTVEKLCFDFFVIYSSYMVQSRSLGVRDKFFALSVQIGKKNKQTNKNKKTHTKTPPPKVK